MIFETSSSIKTSTQEQHTQYLKKLGFAASRSLLLSQRYRIIFARIAYGTSKITTHPVVLHRYHTSQRARHSPLCTFRLLLFLLPSCTYYRPLSLKTLIPISISKPPTSSTHINPHIKNPTPFPPSNTSLSDSVPCTDHPFLTHLFQSTS